MGRLAQTLGHTAIGPPVARHQYVRNWKLLMRIAERECSQFRGNSMRTPTTVEALAPKCKECGHTVARRYCANCGQKTSVDRLNFEELFLQTINAVLHFTNRSLFTLYELIFRPGQSVQAYINGKRQSYQSPAATFTLGYLMLYSTIFLLRKISDTEEEIGAFTALERPAVLYKMLIVATVIHFIAAKPRLNLTETLAAFMYVYGHVFLLAVPLVSVAFIYRVEIPEVFGQYKSMTVDGLVIVLLLVQFYRIANYLQIPKGRLALAIAIGFSYYAIMRYMRI